MEIVRLDWAMKNLLRDKANFDVLEGFLTALLKKDIKILELLESETNQEHDKQKYNRVDILVKDNDDKLIIIEVQTLRESDYLERILFGVSKKIVEHIKLGSAYKNISKVISVSVLYFNLGRGKDYVYYGKTDIRGIHTGEQLIVKERIETIVGEDEIKIKYVEKDIFPEYYFINLLRFDDNVKDDMDEWVYSFKNGEVKDEFHSKNIDKLREKFNLIKMDIETRKRYERYVENMVIEKDVIDTAKEEGIEIGLKKGIEEGLKEGEKKKAVEMAEKMFKKGKTIEEIIEFTELSKEEIEKLKQQGL